VHFSSIEKKYTKRSITSLYTIVITYHLTAVFRIITTSQRVSPTSKDCIILKSYFEIYDNGGGGVIALNESPFQTYGASPAVWDPTVLPATRHR